MSEPAHSDEPVKPKKSKKKLILLLLILLLIGGGGAGAYFFLGGSGEEAEEEEHEEEEHEHHYAYVVMEPFIVNLSRSGSFAKVSMQLRYDSVLIEKALAEQEEGSSHSGGGGEVVVPPMFTDNMPLIRDRIIFVLSSKTGEEVLSQQGKELLKEEILDAVNEILGLDEGPVTEVVFTDFIVQ
jgi:flagellar protein FliL